MLLNIVICEHCYHSWIPRKSEKKFVQCSNCKKITERKVYKVKVKL